MARMILFNYIEDIRRRKLLRVERRHLRDTSDPLQLPEREFIANFRLSKDGFQQVLEELRPHLPFAQRKTSVRNELKILAALNFYANGSYQRSVGASFLFSMSQPTFSKCLHDVTNALNCREVLRKFIKFPLSQPERENTMKGFMDKFRFPGIIGCIDGTHVALVRPTEHEEAFLNRKSYHSLNVLLISDSNLNIIYVNASFDGASHDSYVWNQCPLKAHLENIQERCWLLGDSGYAQRPWLMTPILGAIPGSPEEHYTDLHCKTRNTVERSIGVLKARWRCLLAHRVLHYDPITVGKIVNACVVLHNIANERNIPLAEPLGRANDGRHYQVRQEIARQEDDTSRAALVQRLWNARGNS